MAPGWLQDTGFAPYNRTKRECRAYRLHDLPLVEKPLNSILGGFSLSGADAVGKSPHDTSSHNAFPPMRYLKVLFSKIV